MTDATGSLPGGEEREVDVTATPDAPGDERAEQELLLLLDPAFTPTEGEPDPPMELIVGGWPVAVDGTTGRFRSNPDYVPSRPGSPTDPVDAVLQLLARGETEADELLSVLDDAELAVALDDGGAALVTEAPDGAACVLVATSPPHRSRVEVAGWREVTLAELAAALPDGGVDVLLNPAAPASMRVLADAVRTASTGVPDRVEAPDQPG